MSPAFIRWVGRQLRPVLDWQAQQRRYRISPELRDLDAQERAARAGHKPVRKYQRQRQALMTDLLRRSVHHG